MRGPRISIIGTSGSGKTTVASRAARLLDLPHIELDAIRHGPNWTETPDDEFRRRVVAIAAGEAWIIDGNYGVVRDLVWARATTVVWLDLPLSVVMAQVLWRSLSRAITREELWNGNRERISTLLNADHPIRWALNTHHERRAKFLKTMQPTWVRLRSRREINAWLASLPVDSTPRRRSRPEE
jgi:adenylate kinase family enzyme